MDKIICDTNIWYYLGSQALSPPNNKHLVATWTNVMELGYAHPLNKKDFSPTDRRNAAKAIATYATELIELDPFEYASDILFPKQFIFPKRDLKSVLHAIANDAVQPNTETYQLHARFFDGFNSIKEGFVATMTNFKHDLRKEVNADVQIKNDFKSRQKEYFKFRAIDIMRDVNAYLKQVHSSKIIFDDEEDMKRSVEDVIQKFHFYIESKQKYIRNLALEKRMAVQPNDFLDLHSLLYVLHGDQYWTAETRWQNIFLAAGLEKDLFLSK
jgi:hypothetical protein